MSATVSVSALTGVVVLDASRVLAGPLCGQTLGDHGAEVIKVEAFSGDDTRQYGPPFVDGDAPYFLGLNRNKQDIALDMSTPQGRDLFLDLLGQVDVLIENFKLSTWRNWGFDDLSMLTSRFPRLIHCRISGFGEEGELGGLPGYDAAVQAISGLMSVNGGPDTGPVRMGIALVDIATGMNASMAVMLALYERERSGRGQALEVTLFDTALALQHPHAANVLYGGRTSRTGNGHPNIVPYDLFPTQTGDLFVAIGNDRQFRMLCQELGRPELGTDPDYATNRQRVVNRVALTRALTDLLATQDAKKLFHRLMDLGIPCSPVLSVEEALALPHTASRSMRVELDGYRGTGIPIKLSRTPGQIRRVPPGVGEHSCDVLKRFGFSDEAVQRALGQNIIRQSNLA
jgi:crotonobetainyl-CoA:carnitine CoA-transferase CaiB-like acyl-CoA transferase